MRDKWKWWGQDGWESEDRDIEEEENTGREQPENMSPLQRCGVKSWIYLVLGDVTSFKCFRFINNKRLRPLSSLFDLLENPLYLRQAD